MSANGEGAAKIYTKGGDKGKTSLIGGARVSKANARLETYGTIDELNSIIGILIHEITIDLGEGEASLALARQLAAVQNDLFDLGSHLACEDAKLRERLPRLETSRIRDLEMAMDTFSAHLKPLKNFVLPGGARSAGFAHLARTVCRRAERLTVHLEEAEAHAVEEHGIQYLNRLSDYFFVLARHLNHVLQIDEPLWSGKMRG